MSSCLRCFLPPSPHCFKRTHFHGASVKTTRDQFGLSPATEETLDSYRQLKLLSPKERGSFYPTTQVLLAHTAGVSPRVLLLSTSRYQLLRHLEICKCFTHRKASKRVTFGEERFHVPVLVSKPDLQKHDEPAPELAGHTLGMCSSPVPCKQRALARWAPRPCSARSRAGTSSRTSPQTGAFMGTCTHMTRCVHLHGTTSAPRARIHG